MKYLQVTMPDKSLWEMPAYLIAQQRAAYFAKDDTGQTHGPEFLAIYNQELEIGMEDDWMLIDWASNEMKFEDVEHVLVQVQAGKPVNYAEGWTNGRKRVVERDE